MKEINKNLIFGTWELDGKHNNLSMKKREDLIKFAKAIGINKFDTALVYGGGEVEKILGKILEESDYVISKIPAIIKPELTEENFSKFYTPEHIEKCLKQSLKNLKREKINCVLFHNWAYGWGKELIEILAKFKALGVVDEIGISIPNSYTKKLSQEILEQIDVIEIPYNQSNLHNAEFIKFYKNSNKKVFIRSLFQKGTDLGVNKSYSCLKKIRVAQKFKCPLVIGMTSAKQIQNNYLWSQNKALVNQKIQNTIFDNNIVVKQSDKNYVLNNVLFGTLDKNLDSPIHNISVSNNSLSIDIWKGCSFRCKYCHVQGIYEDIREEGRMSARTSRRNAVNVESVVTSLFSHPYFIPDETIISIGTSCTEPLAKGEVLDSTMDIMNTFVKYGLRNPFWIVTKASLENVSVKRIKEIAKNGNKIMFSICCAGNPVKIEPARNNRFAGVNKFHGIKNVYISWYMRPLVREWGANNANLTKLIQGTSKKYGKYIDYIVPGGMRWTEGVEYGLCEINKEPLPNLQKHDNKKTLDMDIINNINELCSKYFKDIEVFYNSSCPLSRMLNKNNINVSQVVKNNCVCSLCNRKCSMQEMNKKMIKQFNDFISARGFKLKLVELDIINKKLVTDPSFKELHYVEQQILKQFLAEFLDEFKIER